MSDVPSVSLPIDSVLPELQARLAGQGGAVLQAPPGAGKSTRVPLALRDARWRAGRKILLLEPRRVAARAVAERMARQLGETVGQTIGYRMRQDTRIGRHTVIEVVTEGVLTRLLLDDPSLDDYAAVLFDEYHERSLQADLGLALVQEMRTALRDDLRLLVMSATLDGAALAKGLALPQVVSEGGAFPVTVAYEAVPRQQHWLDHCAARVRQWAGAGTLLVFLPGVGEIERVRERLAELPVPVDTLHGRLSSAAQARVLRAPDGNARVVLTTNVAETSVTIDGVTRVIDSGFERRPSYDARRQRSRLLLRRISQANADQRAGRAGRLGPGQCLRLWAREDLLARHIEPEIRHCDLQGLALDLACWGCRDPSELFWLDPPPEGAWQAAVARLQRQGALDDKGAVTPLGQALGQLPLTPEVALLVMLGRRSGLPVTAACLAVLLEERMPGLDREIDLAERLARFSAHPERFPALRQRMRQLATERRDERAAGQVGLLLARAFPERIARRRDGDERRYLLADGSGAALPHGHRLASADWLMVLDTNGQREDALIRLAWTLDEAAVATLVREHTTATDHVSWNDRQGRVEARRVRALGAIVIASKPLAEPGPEQVEAGLIAGLRCRGLSVLPWSEPLRQWRARAQHMHRLQAEGWPDFSDATLLADLEQWLAPFLPGRRHLKDLRDLPLKQALSLRLGFQREQQLDHLLPATLPVASGRQVRLDYCAEGAPRLAVKLQECFGMTELPRLADGRVALTAELLTPAGRPAAITGDLARFWQEGYPQVRKDLRGRYPKHPWPEDPLTALATARTKRRMRE